VPVKDLTAAPTARAGAAKGTENILMVGSTSGATRGRAAGVAGGTVPSDDNQPRRRNMGDQAARGQELQADAEPWWAAPSGIGDVMAFHRHDLNDVAAEAPVIDLLIVAFGLPVAAGGRQVDVAGVGRRRWRLGGLGDSDQQLRNSKYPRAGFLWQ
jgi:hypothetical protein